MSLRVFRSPDHEGGENAHGHQRHEKLICGLACALKFRQRSKFQSPLLGGKRREGSCRQVVARQTHGSGERSAFQIRAFEVRADQACFLQICADEAGVAQVCEQQIRALQVRGVQIRESQADPDQFVVFQIYVRPVRFLARGALGIQPLAMACQFFLKRPVARRR